ncbi:MAG: DUF4271 domain-containing protein [Bacteroidales bacterium]|nr:DUF4271 domain-containing protein [Bacteroidales bacterium]
MQQTDTLSALQPPVAADSTTGAGAPSDAPSVGPSYFLEAHVTGDATPHAVEWHPLDFDSLFSAYVAPPPVVRQSLFVGHELPTQHGVAPRNSTSVPFWIFGTLLFLLAAIAFFTKGHRLHFRAILQSSLSIRNMQRLLRDNNINRETALLPVDFIYALPLALTALHVASQPSGLFTIPLSLVFLMLYVGCVLYLLLKNGVLHLLGNIFNNQDAATYYSFNNHIFYLIGLFCLAPMLFLAFYAPVDARTASVALVAVVSALFVVRMVRGLQLLLSRSRNLKFYLFYYLCIVEIVPVLVVIKLIISY